MRDSNFFISNISVEINYPPIPTQVTPASNHSLKLASDKSTPPVAMTDVWGMGPLRAPL
jgi:hypothetical protein